MNKPFHIVKDTATSLRARSIEIPEPIAAEFKQLSQDMLDYLKMSQDEKMREKYKMREGIGLAAPQIGKNIRLLTIYYPINSEDGAVTFVQHRLINPQIISESLKLCFLSGGEGCLSVDEKHDGKVYRNFKITVKAFDVDLDKVTTFIARGYEAIVLQHEIDHLNGILYYDHIDKKNPDKSIPGSIEI